MSTYDTVRLETKDGTVVANLAPEFEVNTTMDNDLFAKPRRGAPSIVRDQRRVAMEVTVQGVFEHSSNLPDAHAAALEGTFFGGLPVTPRDQVNRIRKFAVDRSVDSNSLRARHLYFWDGDDAYTNETASSIDWEAGQYPPVTITQLKPVDEPGAARYEYTLDLQVGTREGI